MSYRDDLEAALARIAVLEQRLSGERAVGQEAELRSATEALRNERDRLARELDLLRYEHSQLSERLYGRPRDVERMKTLFEHNRQQPVLSRAPLAGVLCPSCIAVGERVEMFETAPAPSSDAGMRSVTCPRCLME